MYKFFIRILFGENVVKAMENSDSVWGYNRYLGYVKLYGDEYGEATIIPPPS